MRNTILSFLLIAGLLLLWGTAFVEAGGNDPTTDLLIRKGIITEREAKTLQEEIKVYNESQLADGGLQSLKKAKFQIGGELEFEVVNSGKNSEENYHAHFQIDKFVLKPHVQIEDDLALKATLEFTEAGTELDTVEAIFSNLIWDTWVDVGLYGRWVNEHYDRELEGYPIIGTGFWRDNQLAISWGGEYYPVYWILAIGNGYKLSNKQVSEDTANSNDVLHDDHEGDDYSLLADHFEYQVNLGFKQELLDGELDIMGFFITDELSAAEDEGIEYLQSEFSGYTSNSDTKRRQGVSLKYNFEGLRLAGQYIMAQDGELDRQGFVIEAGYKIKYKGREWFRSIMPIISYGGIDVDNDYDRGGLAYPLSWDRQNLILGLIVELYKNTNIKLEHYRNSEDTGANDVSNDEIMAQLEIKF